jgi:hypothetical protein
MNIQRLAMEILLLPTDFDEGVAKNTDLAPNWRFATPSITRY